MLDAFALDTPAASAAADSTPSTPPRPVLALRTTAAPATPAPIQPREGWLVPSPSPLALARAFVAAHGEALADAVHTLGGETGGRRHARLLADLRRGALTDGQVVRGVRYLHDLLTLRHVGDPAREESGCFAMLHPDDPVVHDLCRLAEAVGALVAELREAAERRQVVEDRTHAVVVQQGRGRTTDRDGHAREVVSMPANRAARVWRAIAAEEAVFGQGGVHGGAPNEMGQASGAETSGGRVVSHRPRPTRPERASGCADQPRTRVGSKRTTLRKAPRSHRHASRASSRRAGAWGAERRGR